MQLRNQLQSSQCDTTSTGSDVRRSEDRTAALAASAPEKQAGRSTRSAITSHRTGPPPLPARTKSDPEEQEQGQTPSASQSDALPDAALTPVERYVPAKSPAFRSGQAGWIAAATLLVVGGVLYVFAVVPLQRALDEAERASVRELELHTAAVAQLAAQVERERSALMQLKTAKELAEATARAAQSEAAKADAVPQQPTGEQTLQERRPTRRQRAAARRAARAAARAEREHSRAAAPAASLGATAPHAKGDALAGVLSESDDPLRGL
jgi:hypothetical protein